MCILNELKLVLFRYDNVRECNINSILTHLNTSHKASSTEGNFVTRLPNEVTKISATEPPICDFGHGPVLSSDTQNINVSLHLSKRWCFNLSQIGVVKVIHARDRWLFKYVSYHIYSWSNWYLGKTQSKNG